MTRSRGAWMRRRVALGVLTCWGQVVFAAEPDETLCRPVVAGETTVESEARIAAAGQHARPARVVGPTGFDWNDTMLGVVRAGDDGHYLFFGSDGSCHRDCNRPLERDGSITRTVGTLDNPLGDLRPTESILPGPTRALPGYMLYAGGGPAYRVPRGEVGAGTILLIYQPARASYQAGYHYPDCDATGYCNGHQNGDYSYLGLASSTDDGRTWRDHGLILSAGTPYDPQLNYDIGPGNLVVFPHRRGHDGDGKERFFRIYFPDLVATPAQPKGVATRMSVARVSYDRLLDAIARDVPLPAFHKFHEGAWTEPGLGGASSDLLVGVAGLGVQPGNHFDSIVIWNRASRRFASVFSDTHTMAYAESADGLHWSRATMLAPRIDQNTQVANYATPVGLGRDPGVIGHRFYIYYNFQQYYGAGAGWPSAELRRMEILCRGAAEDGTEDGDR